MATRRKSTAKPSAGMFSGILIGLVIGLAAAVAVALYVTKAPMPFMDKASQEIERILLPDVQHAPDPNIGLYGEMAPLDQPIFIGKEAEVAQNLGQVAAPSTPSIPTPSTDALGNLIAQLPSPHAAKPSAPKTTTQVAKAAPSTYYLQAGAFRSAQDAESMRARILLLGLDATVQKGEYSGGTINRVRVGPFNGLDQMNQARATLGKEKIETSVVRP